MNLVIPSRALAADMQFVPVPGSFVQLTPAYDPICLKGMILQPEKPFDFNFIVDKGQEKLTTEEFTQTTSRLIKYFLVSMTVPEKQAWVNLSPYEKNRIIPQDIGKTVMGHDMLSQDYLLKQLTASLMYPEKGLGEKFWEKIYEKAYKEYGTTDIPIDTFNKVWIVPDQANVFVQGNKVIITKSSLKVMLDEDYLALEANKNSVQHGLGNITEDKLHQIKGVSSEMIREIIIPVIEKEVNEGKNFAKLRQIYHSMILAAWYKKNLRNSILVKKYADLSKMTGIDENNPKNNQDVYEKYLEAFRKGVYNYIKEEYDPLSQQIVPKKYFSGGLNLARISSSLGEDDAISSADLMNGLVSVQGHFDSAMAGEKKPYVLALAGRGPRSGRVKQLTEEINGIKAVTLSGYQEVLSKLNLLFHEPSALRFHDQIEEQITEVGNVVKQLVDDLKQDKETSAREGGDIEDLRDKEIPYKGFQLKVNWKISGRLPNSAPGLKKQIVEQLQYDRLKEADGLMIQLLRLLNRANNSGKDPDKYKNILSQLQRELVRLRDVKSSEARFLYYKRKLIAHVAEYHHDRKYAAALQEVWNFQKNLSGFMLKTFTKRLSAFLPGWRNAYIRNEKEVRKERYTLEAAVADEDLLRFSDHEKKVINAYIYFTTSGMTVTVPRLSARVGLPEEEVGDILGSLVETFKGVFTFEIKGEEETRAEEDDLFEIFMGSQEDILEGMDKGEYTDFDSLVAFAIQQTGATRRVVIDHLKKIEIHGTSGFLKMLKQEKAKAEAVNDKKEQLVVNGNAVYRLSSSTYWDKRDYDVDQKLTQALDKFFKNPNKFREAGMPGIFYVPVNSSRFYIRYFEKEKKILLIAFGTTENFKVSGAITRKFRAFLIKTGRSEEVNVAWSDFEDRAISYEVDQAMNAASPVGGIDMNSQIMDLVESGQSLDLDVPVDPVMLDNMNFTGLIPVITRIVPIEHLISLSY